MDLCVKCGSEEATIWLSPELVDFKRPIDLTFNGKRVGRSRDAIQADLVVLLEDARTRGDRMHPFWAKVEMPSGRINLAEAPQK